MTATVAVSDRATVVARHPEAERFDSLIQRGMHVARIARMDAVTQREKLGQLTSSVGAGILGVGIGAMIARPLENLEPFIIVAGLVLHLWGMIDTHRAGAGSPQPWWSTAAYWVCWIGLAALAVAVVLRAL